MLIKQSLDSLRFTLSPRSLEVISLCCSWVCMIGYCLRVFHSGVILKVGINTHLENVWLQIIGESPDSNVSRLIL
jgi:hypothetical protein